MLQTEDLKLILTFLETAIEDLTGEESPFVLIIADTTESEIDISISSNASTDAIEEMLESAKGAFALEDYETETGTAH